MGDNITRGLAKVLVANRDLLDDEIEFRWHAGEPLLAGTDFYRDACEVLSRELEGIARARFSIQTNATMLNEGWCRLFSDFDFEVGVSIDGPPSIHDVHRVTRQGRGTFARTMAGVNALQAAGIAFDVIAVVSPETLDQTDDFLDFFEHLQPRSLGVNPEETEMGHESTLFGTASYAERYRHFLQRLSGFERRTGITIREFQGLRRRLQASSFVNEQVEPLAMLNVDVDGNMSTFSPELLGASDARFGDFVFANVLDAAEDLRVWGADFGRFADEVLEGKERCQAECGYFEVCGGGAPVNKFFEHGTAAATVTDACRTSVMMVTDVVLDELEGAA